MARKPPVAAGDLIAIPVECGFVPAKVLFVSSYFKDVVLLSIASRRVSNVVEVEQAAPVEHDRLHYTRAAPFRNGRWNVVARQEIMPPEHALSRRIVAGDVWLGDEHLGPADDDELRTLAQMLVHGEKLIEKYAANV